MEIGQMIFVYLSKLRKYMYKNQGRHDRIQAWLVEFGFPSIDANRCVLKLEMAMQGYRRITG
jgi:hypothetical protein